MGPTWEKNSSKCHRFTSGDAGTNRTNTVFSVDFVNVVLLLMTMMLDGVTMESTEMKQTDTERERRQALLFKSKRMM